MTSARITNEPIAWPETQAAELARRVQPDTAICCSEPLARRTTLRVGGPADVFVEPVSEPDLAAIVRFCLEQTLPFLVLGRGSNLLVKDGGFRGVVISLSSPEFCRVEVEGLRVRCGAGVRLKVAANAARRAGLAGFEFLEGIPGTVGGALRMNAGAMGGAIFGLVDSVRIMNHAGEVRDCRAGEFEVRYRSCPTLRNQIVLAAVLRGTIGEAVQIEQRLREFNRRRWASQPPTPSAGCIFKNPPSIPAGRLIEELGLKGARVGGAVVSSEHGNFIVNDGAATARDVLELIELITERARSSRGIELETEVQIVGE